MSAITEFREDHAGRSASQTVDDRGTLQRTYTRVFWAKVNDPRLGPGVVLAHPALPLPWDLYVTDTDYDVNARVISRTPTHTSPFRWDIKVEYSTRPLQSGTPNGGDGHSDPFGGTAGNGTTAHPNPLLRRARFSSQSRDFQKPCDVDLTRTVAYPDGQRVRNSAGEPFDPPIVHDCAALTFRVVKNYAFMPAAWFEYLEPKAVNAEKFCGFDKETVKINGISATDVMQENEISYVEVTFDFWYRALGWTEKPLDQGFLNLVIAGGLARFVRILEPGGAPISKPALLDGFGRRVALGGTPVFLDGTVTAVGRKPGPFITQPKKNFNIFGI